MTIDIEYIYDYDEMLDTIADRTNPIQKILHTTILMCCLLVISKQNLRKINVNKTNYSTYSIQCNIVPLLYSVHQDKSTI